MATSIENLQILQNIIDFVLQEQKHHEIIQICKVKFNIEHLSLELIHPSVILQHLLKNDIKTLPAA